MKSRQDFSVRHRTRLWVPRKIVTRFTRDLAIMLAARMLLVQSIAVLARQSGHRNFTLLLRHVQRRLENGAMLADCLRIYPLVFGRFYIHLVEVGEVTGRLDEMLARIAGYREKIAELQRKFVQAMTYPALVIGVALLAVGFIMIYVIPTFADIFRDFNAELPWSTRQIFRFSRFLQRNFILLVFGLTAVVLGGYFLQKHPRLRSRLDGWSLLLPLAGEWIRKHHISQFCYTLGMLMESGISLLDGLDIAARSSSNTHIRREVLKMRQYVSAGEQMATSLAASRIFPLMVTRMLAVGEETAALPTMLIRIAELYDRELDSTIETLASVVEPLVILLLGLIIGMVLMSIYLPLFNMSSIMG